MSAWSTVPIGALAGLCLWITISLGWTSSAELTVTEAARAVAYLGVVIAVVAWLPPHEYRSAIAGATIGAVAICGWALTRRLWPGDLADVVSIFPGDSRRLSAPFGYWNAVGGWSGMTLILCLGWAAHARSRAWRAAAAAAAPAAVAVSYLTYSRAAVGGAAFGLVVLLAIARNRVTLLAVTGAVALASAAVIAVIRSNPAIADATGGTGNVKVLAALTAAAFASALVSAVAATQLDRVRLNERAARIAIPAGIGVGAITLAVLAVALAPDLWDQFTTTSKAEGGADPAARLGDLNGARYDHFKVAWEAFQAAPWKGSGAGTFEYAWNLEGPGGFVRDAHSLYLEALAELGIVGLILIILFALGIALAAWRAIATLDDVADRGVLAGTCGALAAYLLGAGVDWLWESPGVTVLAMVLVGTLIVAGARPATPPRWPWRIAFAGIAIVCAAIQLPGLVSTSEIRKSQDELRALDVADARLHADSAIDAQPWAAAPYIQRALVDERAGALDAALAELKLAAHRTPLDWRIPLITARIQARRGDPQAALASLRRAKELRPRSQFFQTR